ncbi:MAG: 4-hydroxy-tetrahydrodipicolinate synthase [Candidatus Coatesbacteria bacterium]|nr:4-hydroxy-tetrahydrodipicolinate synthase [Candidatus Coatesbacteria bacterium]
MFGRIVTAMVTPFKEDLSLDLQRARELVDKLIEDGTDTVLVGGTTGESPTLSHEEKLELYEAVIKHANNRVKVMCGAGSYNTKETAEFAKEISTLKPDALLIVSPYYNKPPQEGLYQHFRFIAESTDLPIMMYNIPGRCSVNMLPDTVSRLSEIDSIVALKEAAGSVEQCSEMVRATRGDFLVYSGDDGLTIPFLSVGAVGVVSVLSNIYGKRFKETIMKFVEGKTEEAVKMNLSLQALIKGLFFTTSPIPVKYMLKFMGFDCGGVRLPLVAPDKATEEKIKKVLKDYALI